MHDEAIEETDTDVEIVEEGEEAKMAGPMPAVVARQPNLTLATYRIFCSCVTKKDLDDYVAQGLLKSSLHGLCCALGREKVPYPEPYEAIVFSRFL